MVTASAHFGLPLLPYVLLNNLCVYSCMVYWFFDSLIGLVDELIGSLNGWMVDWLIDWLVGWLIDWLIGGLVDWWIDSFIRSLIHGIPIVHIIQSFGIVAYVHMLSLWYSFSSFVFARFASLRDSMDTRPARGAFYPGCALFLSLLAITQQLAWPKSCLGCVKSWICLFSITVSTKL